MQADLIERGLRAAERPVVEEDRLWSEFSSDKVDIGLHLAAVLRTLHHVFPLTRKLHALSIGSSSEPQFRLLEANCTGGLVMVDVDARALQVVDERARRQSIEHVRTVEADYSRFLETPESTDSFVLERLNEVHPELILMHHSLYYSAASAWPALIRNLYQRLLARQGAIHAVLMASKADDVHTTTWLYNHFTHKFFGHVNDQDLRAFATALPRDAAFRHARIMHRRSVVRFLADDFEQLMTVVWMIMLYPEVHKYSEAQRREITEHVYRTFWEPRQPLLQWQDHVAIYRGVGETVLL